MKTEQFQELEDDMIGAENDQPNYVDPETGEVNVTDRDIIANDILPRLARWMKSIDRKIRHIEQYDAYQCNTIREFCARKIKPLKKQRTEIIAQVAQMIERVLPRKMDGSLRAKSHDVLGVGAFGLRDSAPGVDKVNSSYFVLVDKEKLLAHNKNLELFEVRTIVEPKLSIIRKRLADGEEVPGFVLSKPKRTTYFKPIE